jgi:hypothetical protein
LSNFILAHSLICYLSFCSIFVFFFFFFFTERVSDESIRSHDSDIDDSSAAVYIKTSDGYCNGTLIVYDKKLYVWTVAHALIDTTQVELGCKRLKSNIKLLIPDNPQNPTIMKQLVWSSAHHSYHLFPWEKEQEAIKNNIPFPFAEEKNRGFDVLVFELDPIHDELQSIARVAYQAAAQHHAHDTVLGCYYKPSAWDTPQSASSAAAPMASSSSTFPSSERISTKISERDHNVRLGFIDHIASPGSSGAGLIDREHHLQGCIASCAYLDKGAMRTVVIVPTAFERLYKELTNKTTNVITIDNLHHASDLAGVQSNA